MSICDLQDADLLRQQGYIDGQWCEAAAGGVRSVVNPANGVVLGHVPDMGQIDTERAIAAAARAFAQWGKKSAAERGALLYRWHQLLLEHQQDLGRIMTLEQGKPFAEAKGEILYAASFLHWFAEESRRVYGDVIPAQQPGQHLLVLKQPVGVCAAITPWNFPAAMITRKAGAALAAGCTMVVKPASATPYSALALAELAHRAGLPPGVFNVITGRADEIGQTLTDSAVVRKISFTGSTDVGRRLMRQSAEHIQKISLELGGNAPFIVFDDADLDKAVAGAMAAKFRNTGQTCVCVNRFLVQRRVHDVFVEKLSTAMQALHTGDGFETGVNQTALINDAAVAKVDEHLRDALEAGATIVSGGQPHPLGGRYVSPTLITGVTPTMRVCREETFGPLAAVLCFDTEEQAIALANDTPFGLSAYFYSRDMGRIWRVAEALEAGMVGINEGLISNAAAPFGGIKESGLGREGSKYGLDEYLELKYLCMGAS